MAMTSRTPYRVWRRRWPMIGGLVLGLLQIAVGIDTLFTHFFFAGSASAVTTVAAVLFLALGAIMIVLVAANLIVLGPVIEATDDGLALGITGPGEPPVFIPWSAFKGAEVGRTGRKDARGRDPLCLIIRFNPSQVRRPAKLYGVHHATKGSFYIPGSQLPALDPIARRLMEIGDLAVRS